MKKKNFLVVIAASFLVFGLALAGLLMPDKEVSVSERRPLAGFPSLSLKTVADGSFQEGFEEYSPDHFPFRDGFRTIKALTSYKLFRQKDNNGIYLADGYLSKLDYPENLDSVKKATDRFRDIIGWYADENAGVFFSVIPDKNYFLAQKNGYLSMDYDRLISFAKNEMSTAEYIDITGLLELSDYYRTDSHWRQECITDVAGLLAEKMGTVLDEKYTENLLSDSFLGVYAGQSALSVAADELYCLETQATGNCLVYDAETERNIPVYNSEKLNGNDFYEVYLSGAKSLLKIKNPKGPSDKKLIVFRDSFASSLAPLLISGYRELTLVDIRYISPKILERFIDFSGQDILFLYSTGVLNNSVPIK